MEIGRPMWVGSKRYFSLESVVFPVFIFALIGSQVSLEGSAIAPVQEPVVLVEPEMGVRQIAEFLPENPSAHGRPISDRVFWDAFALRAGDLIKEADQMLGEPTPVLSEELYLTFSRKGTRQEYEKPFQKRLNRLAVLTQAECATHRGKYVAAIQNEISAILQEKTWTFPAFDKSLDHYHGKIRDVDLATSMRGATLATAVSWLGEVLPQTLRDEAQQKLRERVIEPYLSKIRSEDTRLCYWTQTNHNWNAVCHTGVVLTALAILPSRMERAEILAGTARHLPTYLSGFPPDGYCEEGMVYWNYGFGHYMVLSEVVLRATRGRMDFYQPAVIRQIATYPDRMEIVPGVYPAFADSSPKILPHAWLVSLCHRRFTVGETGPAPEPLATMQLYEVAVSASPLHPRKNPQGGLSVASKLRGWFPDAGILVSRPEGSRINHLSAVMCGGNNGANHNHNDVGQFIVSTGGKVQVVDPGGELYTATSFSSRRYESEMLNSMGHSVPRVAGKLQKVGPLGRAEILKSEFTPEQDTLVMDLSSAYEVPELRRLERSFVYSRAGTGSLQVDDRFEYAQPLPFETALITYGTVSPLSGDTFHITEQGSTVKVRISTDGLPFEVVQTRIKTTKKTPPTRIGIRLKHPVVSGCVTCRFSVPADAVK
jgi:hypothetical protein